MSIGEPKFEFGNRRGAKNSMRSGIQAIQGMPGRRDARFDRIEHRLEPQDPAEARAKFAFDL